MSVALQAIHGNPIMSATTAPFPAGDNIWSDLPNGEFVISIEADTIEEMSRLWSVDVLIGFVASSASTSRRRRTDRVPLDRGRPSGGRRSAGGRRSGSARSTRAAKSCGLGRSASCRPASTTGAWTARPDLLADDVGLGKTLSMAAAALVLSLLEDKPVLILAPTTLIWQWDRSWS